MAFNIVIPVFPGVTQLDFAGPAQLFAYVPGVRLYLAAATSDAIATDSGFAVVPAATFDASPQADLLCLPGGPGVFEAAEDPVLCDFVRRQASRARYVTSVCTGAFLLGAVGYLKGRKATTHWGYVDALEACGATLVSGRVVRDGNLITAGGVTAGIDFGLIVIEEVFGAAAARTVQLRLEYDPQPPSPSGHPRNAAVETLEAVGPFYTEAGARMRSLMQAIAL